MTDDAGIRKVALFGVSSHQGQTNLLPCIERITDTLQAGGSLGEHILNALLDALFTVTVICRPESTLEPSAIVTNPQYLPHITAVRVALEDEPCLVEILTGQGAVVASIGRRGGLPTQRTIIDAAVRAGVWRFIPSEFGADTQNDALIINVPLVKQKRAILEHLQRVSAKTPSFKWAGISCAAFLDWVRNFLSPCSPYLRADKEPPGT